MPSVSPLPYLIFPKRITHRLTLSRRVEMMIGLAGSLLSSLAPILIVLRCRAFQQQPTRFEKNHPRGCDNRLGIECRSVADPNSCIKNSPEVLCVGETLYDCLPEAIFLGGATTNVGVHLSCMGTSTAVVTSLGSDQLGNEAIRRLQIKGVNTDYIQKHPNLGTGMVTAELDENGDASYTFDTPAAWDGIELTDELHELLRNDNGSSSVKVIVIGTIASRLGSDQGSTTAASISELRNLAKDDTIVLDVNLRAPWYDPESILALSRGDGKGKRLAIVKLNEEELPIVEKWCGADDSSKKSLRGEKLKQRLVELGNSLNARRVCVTRGGDGAALWCNNEDGTDDFVEHDGYDCDEEPGFDTVGAGDSFLAALIRSLLLEKESASEALDRASALGGYVAKRRGAVPDHRRAPEDLRQIFSFR